jgi:hypothetical protein
LLHTLGLLPEVQALQLLDQQLERVDFCALRGEEFLLLGTNRRSAPASICSRLASGATKSIIQPIAAAIQTKCKRSDLTV